MFKKLLSALTVMLFVFGMNVSAQDLQKAAFGKVMPKFAGKNVVTSKVDLAGDEFWTGFWDGEINDNTQLIGVQKVPMTYGCAIAYPAGSAVANDKTIQGIKFIFADDKNIGNVKIFMSTKPISSAAEADICVDEVKDIVSMQTEGDDYINEVRFSKPYKFDSSKDLYIGYFFDVTGGNGDFEKFPVCIQKGPDKKNGLFLSFGGEPMQDFFGNGFGVIAMQVLMSGTFEDNDVAIAGDLGSITGSKDSFDLPVRVENAGSKGISSLELEVTVGDVKTTAEVKAPSTIMGIGKAFEFKVNVNTPSNPGSYKYSVKVTKINGVAATKEIVGNGMMKILSKLAKHKVVVEEFTGMWCGWCPRGMVALEKMSRTFGDDVVRIAAHSGDALECKEYGNVIKALASGFPMAAVDRAILGIDPYYGTNKADFGIKADIEKRMAIAPVAEVVSKPTIDGDILTATSEVTFFYSGEASDYAVGYVLTENGMKNSSWRQSNYYTQLKGQGIEDIEPLFDQFVNGKSKVAGLTFDEVAIGAKGIEYGVKGSIPAEVTDGVANTHSVEFDLSKYKAIIDRGELCVAAIIFNTKSGEVVNADITPLYPEQSGIEEVEGEEKVVETARYTIDGRRINEPEAGVNIVKFSNGTVKKVIVK